MELERTNQNTGLKNLETSEIENTILSGTAIKDLKDDDQIRAYLRRSFAYLGISTSQMPSKDEKTLLIASIIKNYPNIKVEEIGIAFEMLSMDKLNDVKKELFNKVYSFSYFSTVMNAYIEQKRNLVVTEINRRNSVLGEPSEEEKINYKLSYIEKCVIPPMREYIENGTLGFGNVSIHRIYEQMKLAGLIDIEDSKKSEIFSKYREEVTTQWKDLINKPSTSKNQYDFKSKIRVALEEKNSKTLKDEVNLRCKKEVIKMIIDDIGVDEIELKLKNMV